MNTCRNNMNAQVTATVATVVALSSAFDPWTYFDSNEDGMVDLLVNADGDEESNRLCPLLYTLMDDLATNNTFNCQPLPSSQGREVADFCNYAGVSMLRGCRSVEDTPACLGNALEVSFRNPILLFRIRL